MTFHLPMTVANAWGFWFTLFMALMWWNTLMREILWAKRISFDEWFLPIVFSGLTVAMLLSSNAETQGVWALIGAGFSICVGIVCTGMNIENKFEYIAKSFKSSRGLE